MSQAPSRLDKLMKILDADPSDAFVLYGIAQEHARAGGPEEQAKAVEFYDRCLAADPAYCYAYYHKAVSLQALGRVDEAKATLTAGEDAAKKAGDAKALGEISGFLAAL